MTHTKSRKVARRATKAEFIKIALKHHSKIHAQILWKLFSRSKRGRHQNKFILRILKIIKKKKSRKSRKARKSRKSRKARKSRKSRKSRKARKSRKSRKRSSRSYRMGYPYTSADHSIFQDAKDFAGRPPPPAEPMPGSLAYNKRLFARSQHQRAISENECVSNCRTDCKNIAGSKYRGGDLISLYKAYSDFSKQHPVYSRKGLTGNDEIVRDADLRHEGGVTMAEWGA